MREAKEPSKPLEILVIDDEPSVRDALKDILENYGERVSLAEDGQRGIFQYNARLETEKPYDAVFTDLNMPILTGVDVTRYIKTLTPQIPVVVITGKEQNATYQELSEQLGQLKPDYVIGKPFSFEQIENVLRDIKYNQGNTKQPLLYNPPNSYQS